jgi:hypothetical protein
MGAGIPCNLTIPSTNFSATIFAVKRWVKGRKCADLLTNRQLQEFVFLLLDDGSPSMKPMVTSSQTWQGMGNGYKSPAGDRVSILTRWHMSQEET